MSTKLNPGDVVPSGGLVDVRVTYSCLPFTAPTATNVSNAFIANGAVYLEATSLAEGWGDVVHVVDSLDPTTRYESWRVHVIGSDDVPVAWVTTAVLSAFRALNNDRLTSITGYTVDGAYAVNSASDSPADPTGDAIKKSATSITSTLTIALFAVIAVAAVILWSKAERDL